MKVKALEIRDRGTFIPALAVDMNPHPSSSCGYEEQRYLLRRCGYSCDGKPCIILTRLDGKARQAPCDPYDYNDRTWHIAHKWVIENWPNLNDGDVVDVEFILGETDECKESERIATPL